MPLPYELRLGVTGHRSVADEDAVGAAIDSLLARIAATLNAPGTALSCVVISPLAAGADRIVARAAVVDELPGPRASTLPGSISYAQRRDAAYHRVGERVVDACEILIAVWNGRRAAGMGGTADIIAHALRRDRLVIWIHADQPNAPPSVVRRITYRHVTDDEAVVETAAFPDDRKELSPGYHQQASYFRDGGVDDAAVGRSAAALREQLRGTAERAGIAASALTGIQESLVPEFVRADALAVKYQRRHVLVVNGILRLAATAVTMALIQLLFFPAQTWLSLIEIAAMTAVFGLWRGSRRGAWHEKWLHDRFLAEQLRAAMFVVLADARQPASDDRTLEFYRGPKHWLSQVVTSLAAAARQRLSPIPLDPLRRLLVDGWLRDQQAFHERNAHRKAHQAHRRHQLGFALFGGTLLMATLHFLHVGDMDTAGRPWLNPAVWITFLALVFPVWAGVVHAITTQLELERVAERSTRMATTLAGLADRMERALTQDELAETARETSAVMLGETHDWWVLLSFQDVKLHV